MAGSVDAARVRAALVTSGSRWSQVEHHSSLGSTNARASQWGTPWQVVVADHQSAGRGRMRRSWEAPPGTSLAVSASVPMPAAGAGWLPLLAGVALLEAIEVVTGLAGVLKWPNDVLLEADGRRKVCGILCEVAPSGIVVIGAGLNLTQSRDELPVATATSLRLSGAEVNRSELLVAYLTSLESRYAALSAGRSRAEGARTAYRSRCSTLGEEVALSQPSGPDVVGRAVEVDDEGRLVLEAGGRRHAWAAGDVVHVRPPAAPATG